MLMPTNGWYNWNSELKSVTNKKGTIASLLGASPGASTAAFAMINILEKCFGDKLQKEWRDKLLEMVPTYGRKLKDNAELTDRAKLVPTKDAEVFELPTSSGKTKKYKEYGTVTFSLEGQQYSLKVYQSQDLIKKPGFKDHLFLPFRDATNEKETYGGGRYIDLKIPKKDNLMIDFNKAL
ncbi:hypothetical protein FQR65_LT15342 [Abscondita terminalis]|nr:hypothetical protein FQR65_LT15342 [Abscondita terminalis]